MPFKIKAQQYICDNIEHVKTAFKDGNVITGDTASKIWRIQEDTTEEFCAIWWRIGKDKETKEVIKDGMLHDLWKVLVTLLKSSLTFTISFLFHYSVALPWPTRLGK